MSWYYVLAGLIVAAVLAWGGVRGYRRLKAVRLAKRRSRDAQLLGGYEKVLCGYCRRLTREVRSIGGAKREDLRCRWCGARFYRIEKDERDRNLLRLGVTMRTGLTFSELSRGERRRWVR